jgi:hypothetical protein
MSMMKWKSRSSTPSQQSLDDCHWSAQTNVGDLTGVFPVPYLERINTMNVRRAVAGQTLARWHAPEGAR